MSDHFYPSFSEHQILPLKAVIAFIQQDPDYLTGPDCPYSPDLKSLLNELVAKPIAAGPSEFEKATDKLEFIESEIGASLQDLKHLNEQGLEPAEKLQVAKARAGLIEKLINSRERVWNIREMSVFQGQVIQFLEDICTKDQITELKQRLRGLKTFGLEG